LKELTKDIEVIFTWFMFTTGTVAAQFFFASPDWAATINLAFGSAGFGIALKMQGLLK